MAIPGLPALASDVIIDTVALATQDVLSNLGTAGTPQWGLFLDGEPVVVSDNVISFEFKQDYRISNFPVEPNSFESYNKVQVPYDVRLQFSTGGSVADREAMLASIDAIIGSTDLFDAVTPEKVYQSVNPVHQSLRRTSRNGVGLIVIDVYCEQVRVTATQQFVNSAQNGASTTSGTGSAPVAAAQIDQPQSPSASPQVSDGTVQPVTPTPAQLTIFNNAMPLP